MENNDFQFSKKGVTFGWRIVTVWGWRVLEVIVTLALAGHMYLTHVNAQAMTIEQQKQNMRLDRIERAITACLDKTLDCEAQKAERIPK